MHKFCRLRETFLFAACILSSFSVYAQEIYHAQGEMAGEVTAHSVLLQSRLTTLPGPELNSDGDIPPAQGIACFEWGTASDFSSSRKTDWLKADPQQDSIIRTSLTRLQPGTRYYYRLIWGTTPQQTHTGPTCTFRTLPEEQSTAPLRFCMGSCMNYHSFMSGISNGGGPVTATPEDRQLGYPVFAAMLDLQPDFFIGTGDIVYYDHPRKPSAQTLLELRRKWHEQFRFPRLIEFLSHTPAYWSKDDHDFRFNDADLRTDRQPLPQTGIDVFREQMPIYSSGEHEAPTYRTHRVHKHLQLWFLEGRDFRSPNSEKDAPGKSIWGPEQRDWLQKTLLASDATWKVLISPTPMVGPDSAGKKDNHTNLGGFRHEADAFFAWLNDNKLQNVYCFCGDRHWQYHSIHPAGLEEFGCGALNDENSIRGFYPGDKNSTDPTGLIKQPFHYKTPTGGFLFVQVQSAVGQKPPTLTIEFRDDENKLLHRTEKTAQLTP